MFFQNLYKDIDAILKFCIREITLYRHYLGFIFRDIGDCEAQQISTWILCLAGSIFWGFFSKDEAIRFKGYIRINVTWHAVVVTLWGWSLLRTKFPFSEKKYLIILRSVLILTFSYDSYVVTWRNQNMRWALVMNSIFQA